MFKFQLTVDDRCKTKSFTSLEGINIYRTIQEALNNAIKYADATEISIHVNAVNERMNILISDNGKGFDRDAIELGNGILNMQKRIEDIGGTFVIHSELLKGTQITISL